MNQLGTAIADYKQLRKRTIVKSLIMFGLVIAMGISVITATKTAHADCSSGTCGGSKCNCSGGTRG